MSVKVITETEYDSLMALLQKVAEKQAALQTLFEGQCKQLTLSAFCRVSGIGRNKIKGMMKRGEIKYSKTGVANNVTIPMSELLNFRQL